MSSGSTYSTLGAITFNQLLTVYKLPNVYMCDIYDELIKLISNIIVGVQLRKLLAIH